MVTKRERMKSDASVVAVSVFHDDTRRQPNACTHPLAAGGGSQRAIARSTASSSSGESAVEERPRSRSLT